MQLTKRKFFGCGQMNWEQGKIEKNFFGPICGFLYFLKVCEKMWLIFYVGNNIVSD